MRNMFDLMGNNDKVMMGTWCEEDEEKDEEWVVSATSPICHGGVESDHSRLQKCNNYLFQKWKI